MYVRILWHPSPIFVYTTHSLIYYLPHAIGQIATWRFADRLLQTLHTVHPQNYACCIQCIPRIMHVTYNASQDMHVTYSQYIPRIMRYIQRIPRIMHVTYNASQDMHVTYSQYIPRIMRYIQRIPRIMHVTYSTSQDMHVTYSQYIPRIMRYMYSASQELCTLHTAHPKNY